MPRAALRGGGWCAPLARPQRRDARAHRVQPRLLAGMAERNQSAIGAQSERNRSAIGAQSTSLALAQPTKGQWALVGTSGL